MKTNNLGRGVPDTIRHNPPARRRHILEGFPPIVRRIAAGVENCLRLGYRPTSLYLVDVDAAELAAAAPAEWDAGAIGGLEIRTSHAARGSRIYCRNGTSTSVPKKPPP